MLLLLYVYSTFLIQYEMYYYYYYYYLYYHYYYYYYLYYYYYYYYYYLYYYYYYVFFFYVYFAVSIISRTLNLFSAIRSKFLFTARQFSAPPVTIPVRNTKHYFEIKKYVRITLIENFETYAVMNFLTARMFPEKWYGVSFYFSTLRISFLLNVVSLASITRYDYHKIW